MNFKCSVLLLSALLMHGAMNGFHDKLITAIEKGNLVAFSQQFDREKISPEDMLAIKTFIKARKEQLEIMIKLTPHKINYVKAFQVTILLVLGALDCYLGGHFLSTAADKTYYKGNPFYFGIDLLTFFVGLWVISQGITECKAGFYDRSQLVGQYNNNLLLIETIIEKNQIVV